MSEDLKNKAAFPQNKKCGLRRSGAFKAFMVLVSTVSAVGIFGGAMLSAEFIDGGMYTEQKNALGKTELQQRCQQMIQEVGFRWQDIANCKANPDAASEDYIDQLCRELTETYEPSVSNFEFVITDAQENVLLQSFTDGEYQYSWTEPFYTTTYETTHQRMTSSEWSVFAAPDGAEVYAEEVWISELVQPTENTTVPETSSETIPVTESLPAEAPAPETLYSDDSVVELAPQIMDETIPLTEYPPLDSAAEEQRMQETMMQEEMTEQFYEEVLYYDVTISYPNTELTHYITGCVRSELTADDDYATYEKFLNMAYDYRYAPPIVLGVSVIAFLCSLGFLLWAAGWRRGEETPADGVFEKIPFDVFTGLIGIAGILLIALLDEVTVVGSFLEIGLIASILLVAWLLILWWLVSAAVRIRTKTILSNNLIVILWKKFWNAAGKGLAYLQQVPFIGLVLLVTAGFFFVHLISTAMLVGGNEFGLVLLILLYTAAIAGVCAAAVNMYLLEKGAEKIAGGDLEHKIPEEKLFGPFRKHGKHLNSIGDGMNLAVSERIRSEMFKTELIANVSHDIRTPLTSIINYTDLLSKLELEDVQAQEYIEVLTRQSARLRKLTEDVLEASKATTGSMKVEKEKMDLRVLVEQIQGEYAEKLESKSLQMICAMPEEPLYISADGRLLWRVMDNLFSNVCKYAMQGTRVYLDVFAQDGQVVLTLRNISAVQLHISADMLMERFVQGDRSRNTEGSGLGLSIAQSLTSLQGGRLKLHIDGDLFKVQMTFPETAF